MHSCWHVGVWEIVCVCVYNASVGEHVFLQTCDCVYFWQHIHGSGRNMWLFLLFLRFKASIEQGHENKHASLRPVFVSCRSIVTFVAEGSIEGLCVSSGALGEEFYHSGQKAGFAWDGLISYIDTDDVISQLPGSLSDMFLEAELQTPNGLLLCLSLELVYSTFKGQDSMKAGLNGK